MATAPLAIGAVAGIGSALLSAPWWASAIFATVTAIAVEGFVLIWMIHQQGERQQQDKLRGLMLMPEPALDELVRLLSDLDTCLRKEIHSRTPTDLVTRRQH